MEVEKLREHYELEVRWWPFLLDPSIPAEGREREPRTKPDDPPTQLEERGERVGIAFRRGRRFTPNSHLALETAEYAQEIGHDGEGLHRALFAAHFEGDADLGDLETLVAIGGEQGLDRDELRSVLSEGRYRSQVDERIAIARQIGVRGVPTFIFNERDAVVGAQEYEVFEQVLEQLGVPRRDGPAEGGP